MVPGVRPVMELEKVPNPNPSVVWSPLTVGLAVVAQHTPRALTDAPPSEETSPPHTAEVEDIFVKEPVVTAGGSASGISALLIQRTDNEYFFS